MPINETYKISLKQNSTKNPLQKTVEKILETNKFKKYKFFNSIFSKFHLKNQISKSQNNRKIVIGEKELINFASFNYLGLDQDRRTIQAAIDAFKDYGLHSGSSRIFHSNKSIFELEMKISKLVKSEASLTCVNVSQIHQGAIPALFGNTETCIFIDKFAHTSIYQAAKIAKSDGAEIIIVNVADKEALVSKLKSSIRSQKVLMLDGIYSMHGHTPDFDFLQQECKKQNTSLYIDDAHGIGILGKQGGGIAERFNVNYDNALIIGSLHKALGICGGFIAGNKTVIDVLRLSASTYVFSGTLQPSAIAASSTAIDICMSPEGNMLRDRVNKYSKLVRSELESIGFELFPADSAIVSVILKDDLRTLVAGRRLFDMGIYVNSVLHPAVPKGQSCLRISICANHSIKEIDNLIQAFKELKKIQSKEFSPFKEKLSYMKQITSSFLKDENFNSLN